jgi:hypothetical protein
MAWAITFIGRVVCVPRFIRCISVMYAGSVLEGLVNMLNPDIIKEPLWKVPEMGTQPRGNELVVWGRR